jgi:hypothetical protein
MSKITDRISAETGIPGLFETLAQEIPPTDLQSLLLAVYQSRARTIREADLLARSTPLTAPSTVDARLLNQFDRIAFTTAADFEAIDLSPVSPFGSSFALGGIDQNNVVTTIRNAEILGDSTEPLALECARRRKQNRATEVRLACSHRVIRMQPFDTSGFTPHFRLFALVSAGRDTGSSEFEMRHMTGHIRFYLELCRALGRLTTPLVEVSDLAITEALLKDRGVSREEIREAVRAHRPGSSERFLAERRIELPASDPRLNPIDQHVFAALRPQFPEAEFRLNLSRLEGIGYYSGLALRISPQAPDGVRYAAIDGGFTDWTARLLSDRKERLLTSGIGSEFVCRRFLSVL